VRALYTRADYERLPEGFPAQLVRGQLVKEPAPRCGHGVIGARVEDVAEVWLVDSETGTIERRSPAESRVVSGSEPLASEALAGFVLVPAEILARP
jgi:hypothetical protein